MVRTTTAAGTNFIVVIVVHLSCNEGIGAGILHNWAIVILPRCLKWDDFEIAIYCDARSAGDKDKRSGRIGQWIKVKNSPEARLGRDVPPEGSISLGEGVSIWH